jgi:hypothetical protein
MGAAYCVADVVLSRFGKRGPDGAGQEKRPLRTQIHREDTGGSKRGWKSRTGAPVNRDARFVIL